MHPIFSPYSVEAASELQMRGIFMPCWSRKGAECCTDGNSLHKAFVNQAFKTHFDLGARCFTRPISSAGQATARPKLLQNLMEKIV
ncbi:hypothetical protein AB4Y42_43050 [Paraburkholderia sp. EG286B]|uniref:hypothetical protein n=1 Tax=Paraburkholderia sp. EG286B TaxID=3237011 RepID=UPI0034D2B71E